MRNGLMIALIGFCLSLITFAAFFTAQSPSPYLQQQKESAPTGNYSLRLPVLMNWYNNIPNSELNCRYGAAVVGTGTDRMLPLLRAGWHLNFGVDYLPDRQSGSEYVQVVGIRQDKDAEGNYLPNYLVNPPMTPIGLEPMVRNNLGSLWLIGNEVDRGPDPGKVSSGQGDTFPDIYAQAYHDVYHYIKQFDPTAFVAPSSMVQVTPGRLQYLDILLEEYENRYGLELPADVWNMHIYILPEATNSGQPNSIANIALGTDPALARRESNGSASLCSQDDIYCVAEHDDMAIFAEQVIAMRQWMYDNGYGDIPLVLSEYSILYPNIQDPGSCYVQDEYGNCFTQERVKQFMQNSFEYMETATDTRIGYAVDNYRLVQQWLWFSTRTEGVGYVSNLLLPDSYLFSEIGEMYRAETTAQTRIPNLVPAYTNVPIAFNGTTGTASAELLAMVRNNGNQSAESFRVTFYRDEELTLPIGSADVGFVNGCTRDLGEARVTWHGLSSGVHYFWAQVDSTNEVAEANENDNVIQGIVFVDPDQTFLPYIR